MRTDVTWTSNAGSSVSFKVFEAWTGEGPTTCQDVETGAALAVQTAGGARSAKFWDELATGGGEECVWVAAVNAAGSSPWVAAVLIPRPPAPTNFTATAGSPVACPAPNQAYGCTPWALAWTSAAPTGTRFKIYRAETEEGGATCDDVQATATLAITTAAGARSATYYRGNATGGGALCLWISAFNAGGESMRVEATYH